MKIRVPVVLMVVLAACTATPEARINEEEIRREVTERVEGYVQAIRDLDVAYMEGFWADVEGFTVAGDATLTIGYDPWIDGLRDLVGRIESVAYVEVENPQVFVFGREAASYAMAYRWQFNMADGTTLSAQGSWMYVLAPVEGEWRVVHSAGSHIYS